MLHLLCRSNNFSKEAATLFKRIVTWNDGCLIPIRNNAGATCVDIAAGALNFWIVKFVLLNFPVRMKALICDTAPPVGSAATEPPLKSMARRIAKPRPVALKAWPPQRRDFEISKMLYPDESTGSVPYGDVAFDVGVPGPDGKGRSLILAHRVIVASRSPVLLAELEKLPLKPLSSQQDNGLRACVFRVDSRISKDVWKCVLQFLYVGGSFSCAFSRDGDRLIELLRACQMYQLPRPLQEFAQASLSPLLPAMAPQAILQIFSIAAGTPPDPSLLPMKEAAAYWAMRGAHELCRSIDPPQMASLLGQVIEAVEGAVFRAPQAGVGHNVK